MLVGLSLVGGRHAYAAIALAESPFGARIRPAFTGGVDSLTFLGTTRRHVNRRSNYGSTKSLATESLITRLSDGAVIVRETGELGRLPNPARRATRRADNIDKNHHNYKRKKE